MAAQTTASGAGQADVATTVRLQKSTKNSHVYEGTDDNSPVVVVYLRHTAFAGKPPKTVNLTLKPAD